MRIRISHETTYTYDGTVQSAVQLLRVTPRSNDAQFVRQWRVSVDADARLDRGEDAYGNITHLIFVDGPIDKLTILVEGEVDTHDNRGIVSGTVERVTEKLFLRETRLTASTPEIAEIARAALCSEGGDLLAALHRINADLHQVMKFEVGETHAETTAAEAFKAKTGVCQDFAHIFIAAARAAGVPARYVSGYYLRSDCIRQEAGHAWAEAYLPSIGWVAFDPAHGICATEQHVRVAIGADAQEAAPIRGARTGGSGEALAVSIQVAPGRRQGQSQSQGSGGQSQQQ